MVHLSRLLKVLVVAVIFVTPLYSQEGKPEEGQSSEGVGVGAIVVRAAGEDGQIRTIQAMEMPASIVFSSPDGMLSSIGMMMNGIHENSINWIHDDDLLEELEIVAEQREKLKRLEDEVQQRRQDFFKAFQAVEPAKKGEFLREFSTLLTAKVDEQVQDILLAHQLERFDQIRLQTELRGSGLNVAHSSRLAELLGITEAQKEEMRKKQSEVQKELQEKIELLKKEALDEVLSVLTDSQRKKLDKLTGNEYKFKPRSMLPGSLLPRPKPDATKDKSDNE